MRHSKRIPNLDIVGYAKSAKEAIDLIRVRSPHLILIDECLLGMTGHEIIKEIREHHDEIAIVGVVSSTDQGRAEGVEMIVQGANSFVEKPPTTGHAANAIQKFEEAILPELIAWGEQVKYTS